MLPSFLKLEALNKVTKLTSCGIRLKLMTETYWLWTASTDCHLNSSTTTKTYVHHSMQECSNIRLFLYIQKFMILTYQYTIMMVTWDLKGSPDNDCKTTTCQGMVLCRLVVNYLYFKKLLVQASLNHHYFPRKTALISWWQRTYLRNNHSNNRWTEGPQLIQVQESKDVNVNNHQDAVKICHMGH